MKINIEGYEAMTTEQKLEALENYDPEANGYVSKAAFDKAASDTAGYKKASRAAQDELKASQDAQKALEDRVKELETARKTAEVSAKFAPFGFAKEATEAFLNGDVEEFVKHISAYGEGIVTKQKQDALKNMPKPGAGSASQGADYAKMIADAQAEGNFAAAAYYMRLSQQESAETE